MADPTPRSDQAAAAPPSPDTADVAAKTPEPKAKANGKGKAAKGVLSKPIHHNGVRIEAGKPIPSDLTKDQVDRFKTLGVIET